MTTLYPHPFRDPMRLVTCFCVLLLSPFVASAQERNNPQAVETQLIGVFPGYAWTTPTAINNKGEIVGQAGPGVTLSYTDAFYWSARTGFRLIREGAVATDINDRGQATVAWRPCDEFTHACTRGGGVRNRFTGQITDHLDGVFPKVINNHGDIAGDCINEEFLFAICAILRGERFQWSCGIADCHLWVTSMNEQGDIVGQKDIDTVERVESAGVFIPRGGRAVFLKEFYSTLDINNSRSIVGGTQENHLPFVWAHRRVLRMLPFVGLSTGISRKCVS